MPELLDAAICTYGEIVVVWTRNANKNPSIVWADQHHVTPIDVAGRVNATYATCILHLIPRRLILLTR